jgi:similar to stage IV sporulation protein
MENRFLERFKETIKIKIVSKNIYRVLKRIYELNIPIFDVKYINRKEVHLKIYYKDYNIIKDLRIEMDIEITELYGKLKAVNIIKNNNMFFIALIIGYIFILILSNIIYKIEVIHSDFELRNSITEILKEKGLRPLTFRKSFNEINNIKEKILIENKDRIEWIEIDRIGTKYIIKLEERKKEEEKKEYIYQDIVSKKMAVIKKIEAENGAILKKVNDYVNKGEVVISGNIYKNNEIVNIIKASGKIYGEVWYNIKVEFPLILDIKEETGENKSIYSFNIFNFNIPILDLKSYKYKTIKSNKILYNKLLPISIDREKQYELKITNGVYTIGEALIEAEKYASLKINKRLKDEEYIIKSKILNYNVYNEKIYLEIFYNIYENITDTKEIIIE